MGHLGLAHLVVGLPWLDTKVLHKLDNRRLSWVRNVVVFGKTESTHKLHKGQRHQALLVPVSVIGVGQTVLEESHMMVAGMFDLRNQDFEALGG